MNFAAEQDGLKLNCFVPQLVVCCSVVIHALFGSVSEYCIRSFKTKILSLYRMQAAGPSKVKK
jgi:hypothetical protein